MSKGGQDGFIEKVEVLDGSRSGGSRRRAAVRIEDLDALLQIPPRLQATKAAGATPTKAEFDALLVDVQTMQARLIAVASALQARLK